MIPPLPYGPQTPAIRHFLVRLAGLSRSDRAQAVASYATHQSSPAFQRAEDQLATVMERSGRDEARTALTGPLLQLVKREPSVDAHATASTADETGEALDDLDPVAEPALAALLALLVRDLLAEETFRALTAPMATVLPIDTD